MGSNFIASERDWETEDAHKDWPRTAILAHIFLTTLVLYSGPHLALTLPPGTTTILRRRWRPAQLLSWLGCNSNWLTVTPWLTVSTCVYIISLHLRILPFCDSRDLLPLVNPRGLFSCLHSWNILSQKSMINSSLNASTIKYYRFKGLLALHFNHNYIYIYIYI